MEGDEKVHDGPAGWNSFDDFDDEDEDVM